MTTEIGPQDQAGVAPGRGAPETPPQFSATGEPPKRPTRFEFDGEWREMLPTVLINILLTIVTLGVYRFWARTRIRRYLWSRLRLDGDAFEYTGTGMELFLGFLIVVFVVLLPMAGLYYYMTLLDPLKDGALIAVIGVILYVTFIALSGAAYYRAWRYRLSRTLWRGIRGYQEEKGWRFGGLYLLWALFTFVTIGIATPYMMNQVWDYPTNRRMFGSGRFAYDGKSGPLFGRFFACVGIGFLAIFVLSIFFGIVGGAAGAFGSLSSGSLDQQAGAITGFIIGIFIFYLVFGLVYGAIWLWFQQKYFEHIAGHTTYEGIALRFKIDFVDLFKLAFGNVLIYILTLGFGADFATLRKMRFMAENLILEDTPDWSAVAQVSDDMPGVGEGLAEAFDVGGF